MEELEINRRMVTLTLTLTLIGWRNSRIIDVWQRGVDMYGIDLKIIEPNLNPNPNPNPNPNSRHGFESDLTMLELIEKGADVFKEAVSQPGG